ncbi:MAG: hypothetical protein GY759_04850 [Chloroflexi bacterium]|nr:hypothetical protein [Chloroflexota bacterium]
MTQSLGPLADGGHAIIMGGGPAGVACALALQRLAAQMSRQLLITVVEGKQFTGERHYNQCAGVLSPPLPTLLQNDLDVPFPYYLSRDSIQGYVLYTGRERVALPEQGEPSIALRRIQFDAYMLETARSRGIEIISARAVDLELHADQVIVYTENKPVQGDVVVGAFGLDEGSAGMFRRRTTYRPPLALDSVVTKYHPGDATMAAFGHYIHAFLPAHPSIEFGAVTPKANHLTINIAGQRVDVPTMKAFLQSDYVNTVLPNMSKVGHYDQHDLRFFKGRFPRSLARGYYGDRYVMVGDSSGIVRAFKGKGVTSSVLTGIRAAHTILEAGISRQAFDDHYRKANLDIIRDLPYGRVMRRLTILCSRYRLLDPVLRAAHDRPELQQGLFGAVSGHDPYRQVMGQMIRPGILAAILKEMPHRK